MAPNQPTEWHAPTCHPLQPAGLTDAPAARTTSTGAELPASEPEAPAVLPEDEGKWWAGYFGRAAARRGGGVGASGRPAITIHGFREQDQENLYNLAQVCLCVYVCVGVRG